MNRHEAVFRADVFSEKYVYGKKLEGYLYFSGGYFNPEVEYEIKKTRGKTLENKLIWRGEIEKPQLQVGDTIYLHEYEEYVEILSVTRSTDGSVIYQTDYKFDLVEDEDTKTSLNRAESEKLQRTEHLAMQECATKEEPKKNWWQRFVDSLKS